MDRAEGVGHIYLSHSGHGFRQLGVVLFLALLEAGVLQQEDLAGREGGGLGGGVGTHHVGGQDDVLAQQLAQAGGNRLQGQLGLDLALGLAHMGAGDDRRALLQQVLDGGQGGADALVVGDDAAAVLGHGHVEVAAKENLLALHVDVLDRLLVVIHGNLAPFSITI